MIWTIIICVVIASGAIAGAYMFSSTKKESPYHPHALTPEELEELKKHHHNQ